MDTGPRPQVIISYAQSSEAHVALVGEFHKFLRSCGVDAHTDTLQVDSLDVAARVQRDDYLLVIASPKYRDIADGDLQVAKEWRVWVSHRIRAYGRNGQNVLPIILADGTVEDIPRLLRSKSLEYFRITDFSLPESAALLSLLPPLRDLFRPGRRAMAWRPNLAAIVWKFLANASKRAGQFTQFSGKALRRSAQQANNFFERISNWFFWAVGGGILPLLCIWLFNFKRDSSLQVLLGSGELFIVSAVLVAATYGELLRERKKESNGVWRGNEGTQQEDENEHRENEEAGTPHTRNTSTWPSQVSNFACFASALGAIAGYDGVATNGSQLTMYLSIVVFLLILVTGASIMNGIEKGK